MTPLDDRSCTLGEGPLWHPLRQQLFWFDIMNNLLLSRAGGTALEWHFNRHVSAAGWIDDRHLLIASETDLFRFDLETGTETRICSLEADRPDTRSNDGRADPWGGFWVGTMGKDGATEVGALYRWYRGELRRLQGGMTTPNAICFAPDRSCAYYADTKTRMIWRQPLDPEQGWPLGERAVFLELCACAGRPEHKPDGAVTDSDGCLWNAQWGSARVARYAPDGRFLGAVELPTDHTSCPAFGGPDLTTLFVTTAVQKLSEERLAAQRDSAGRTFSMPHAGRGLPEPQVLC